MDEKNKIGVLQAFVNKWATEHYRLTMSQAGIMESLKAATLDAAETCDIDDLDVFHVVAGYIGFLEFRIEQGGRIGVEFNNGQWDVFPVLPNEVANVYGR